jgi:hypothetical protein
MTSFITKGKGKNRKVIPMGKSGMSKRKFKNTPTKMKGNFRVPTLPNDPPRSTIDDIDKLGTVSGEPVVAIIRDFTGKRSKHKVTLDIELKEKDTDQDSWDGTKITNPTELSISDSIWQRDESDILSGGQGQDTLREALENGNLEVGNGITNSEFSKLLDIWDAWHLNDTTAGTRLQTELIEEHEDEAKYKKIDDHFDRSKQILEDFDAQPDTQTEGFGEEGYSYGSQWLFKQIPDHVIEFVEEIQEKLEQDDDE